MSFKKGLILGIAACALGLSGCQSTRSALGLQKVVPDEFKVVTKAPLVIPPEFSLRPPAPGEPRPQELQPDSAARLALIGERDSVTRSTGETLLAQKAGADRADPLARYVVDDEFGDLAYKDESFADRVLFWKKPQTAESAASNTAIGQEAVSVNASAEEERLKKLVGDQPILIQQKKETRLKLPGL
jgi:hypothetical protein